MEVITNKMNENLLPKRKLRKTLSVRVLCKQKSKGYVFFPTGGERYLNLTSATVEEKIRTLPKNYGVFADIDHRIEVIGTPAPKRCVNVGQADDNLKCKKPILQRQPTFIRPVEREAWTKLRRASQVPDFEFGPRDYFDMDTESLEAVRKTRTKISASLNLKGDRVGRLIRLRQNVYAIEKKFRSLLKNSARKEKITTDRNGGRTRFVDGIGVDRPSRFSEPGEARMLFRKQARVLLIAIKWLNYVFTKDHLNWEQELKTFADVAVEMQQTTGQPKCLKDTGLNFDKNYYKANREISLSADVRHYLSLTPSARTPDMLQQVLHGLQTLQSLCEYPLKTQERLCKVAWYQRVEAKKVILRQGHYPECFYFILSGAAYVKKISKDTESGEQVVSTVARLTRGQSFGEVSLIFDTLRTATVESATSMELLVISKSEFQSIFMNADDPTEDADHIKFLRQIPVLKHWPIEMLKTEPGTCLLHYFKRGTLVTENGLESEWLYFIKSGSCEVIKRLKAVRGRSPKELRRRINPLYDVILPRLIPGDTATARIDSGASVKRRQRQQVNKDVLESMKTYYDGIKRTFSDQGSATPDTSLPTEAFPASSPGGLLIDGIKGQQIFITQEELQSRIPPVPSAKPNGSPGVSKPRFTELYLKKQSTNTNMLPASSSFLQELTPQREHSPASVNTRSTQQQQQQQVFVKVDILQARDIFGMQTLETEGDNDSTRAEIPAVALVSRGAEVVLLSKKIFLKHADDRVKRAVQEMMTRYPRETTLQENLQIKADWDVYRQSVMKDVMEFSRSVRSLTVPRDSVCSEISSCTKSQC